MKGFKKTGAIALLFFVLPLMAAAADSRAPEVMIMTSLGDITVELYPDKAPDTVANFYHYVDSGFYADTVFHRVIKGFMIQGGGMTENLNRKPTEKPVKNEADNGLKNTVGTLAMARTQAPHSATSQFFINTAENTFLNYRVKNRKGWGYCVFGKVVDGMDVVRAIEGVKTGTKGPYRDVPTEPVRILSVTRVD
ncbi:MAG: peptidylprolyl isomerase [Deltaproteobacteria bacterium]|nr:MAG: peptidylprolyl isomerase [Deltaproteobacteria bacterium]